MRVVSVFTVYNTASLRKPLKLHSGPPSESGVGHGTIKLETSALGPGRCSLEQMQYRAIKTTLGQGLILIKLTFED